MDRFPQYIYPAEIFYNLYSKQFGRSMRVNSVRKEDVSNYQCEVSFVQIAAKDWKMALCARQYYKYPNLWDISMEMALNSDLQQGLIIQLAIAGVSKDNALALIKRFAEEVR